VKPTAVDMSGTVTFNTYAYLLNGAHSLLRTAQEHSPGSNYCRISAVLFSAFAVEAYLNHIGETRFRESWVRGCLGGRNLSSSPTNSGLTWISENGHPDAVRVVRVP